MLKTCYMCKKEKDISLFSKNKSKKNGYNNECKECQKVYHDNHYINNKKDYAKKKIKRKKKIVGQIKKFKETLSCVKCGFSHPAALDFHHRNPNEKDFNISQWSRNGYSFNKLKKEIEKCDVLCANCHRILHYEEKMAYYASSEAVGPSIQ